jgi:hypothetical protein
LCLVVSLCLFISKRTQSNAPRDALDEAFLKDVFSGSGGLENRLQKNFNINDLKATQVIIYVGIFKKLYQPY